jgi:hypothetical protein
MDSNLNREDMDNNLNREDGVSHHSKVDMDNPNREDGVSHLNKVDGEITISEIRVGDVQ